MTAARRPVRPRAALRSSGPGLGDAEPAPVRPGATIAAPWGPRNTLTLYAVATIVGVLLVTIARYGFHDIVPGNRLSVQAVVLAVVAMAIGSVCGYAANQWADHRRRGRGTIAAACPRTANGTLSLSPDALVLAPRVVLGKNPPPHVVPRDQVRSVQLRRTTLLQQELSVTFADGSVACWYAPRWGSATGAFADALRRMLHRPGDERAPAGVA